MLQALQVQRLRAVGAGVGGHGPRAGGRVESRAQCGQRTRAEKGRVEHRHTDDEGGPEVDELHDRPHPNLSHGGGDFRFYSALPNPLMSSSSAADSSRGVWPRFTFSDSTWRFMDSTTSGLARV